MTDHGYMAMTLKPKPNLPNGKRFATIEEIREESKEELLVIPKSALQKYSEDWKICSHKCIISEGDNLEGY